IRRPHFLRHSFFVIRISSEMFLPNICNTITRSYTANAFGFLITGTRRCRRRVLILKQCVCKAHGIGKRSLRSCRTCEIEIYPLMPRYMLKHHAALFSNSRREFWSWNNALRAAGITKQLPKKLYKSRLGTLRSLRDVIEKSSKAAIPPLLKSQATYYFGSLRNALAALKT